MLIAQNRRTMTYRDGDYYVDIVTKDKTYESWIYTQASPKFFMFGIQKKHTSYFDFYEMVCRNLDEYKYMCDADVRFDTDDEDDSCDYSENAPCDNSGFCVGDGCSNYPKCQGWI